jgi:hypothetical protein
MNPPQVTCTGTALSAKTSSLSPPHWAYKEETGEITKDQLRTLAKEQWNILQELQILIKIIEP